MSDPELPFGPDIQVPVMVDFEVEPVMYSARVKDRYLATVPDMSLEERIKIVQSLDSNWPRMNFPVRVSGMLLRPKHDSEADDDTVVAGPLLHSGDEVADQFPTVSFLAEDLECTSLGFEITKSGEDVIVGGENLGVRYAIKLLFSTEIQLKVSDEDDTQEEPQYRTVIFDCVGGLDDTVLTFPNSSPDNNEYVAYEYFGDYIDEIDARFAETTDLASRIMALKGLELEAPHYVNNETLQNLSDYLSEKIAFSDDSAPFFAKLKPDTPCFDLEGKRQVTVNSNRHRLLRFMGIDLAHKTDLTTIANGLIGSNVYPWLNEIRIYISFMEKEDSKVFAIRLRDFENLVSVRDVNPADVFED